MTASERDLRAEVLSLLLDSLNVQLEPIDLLEIASLALTLAAMDHPALDRVAQDYGDKLFAFTSGTERCLGAAFGVTHRSGRAPDPRRQLMIAYKVKALVDGGSSQAEAFRAVAAELIEQGESLTAKRIEAIWWRWKHILSEPLRTGIDVEKIFIDAALEGLRLDEV